MPEPKKSTTVESWEIRQGEGVFINGELFPYWVEIQGPMVEQIPGWEERLHILWMPLVAEGPAPRAGRPNGEPAAAERPTDA